MALKVLATEAGQNTIAGAISGLASTALDSMVQAKQAAQDATQQAGAADHAAQAAEESKNEADDIFTAIKAGYGYPFKAATVAAMTDTTKIYVYTGSEAGYTAGNWYYYDGANWVSGGTFNSAAVQTDDTLSVADEPADAKATGDAVKETRAEMSLFGVDDLLWDNTSPAASYTQGGATWTLDKVNKKITVSTGEGTLTSQSVFNLLYNSPSIIPSWLEKGKNYVWHFSSSSPYIGLQLVMTNEDNETIYKGFTQPTEYAIPDNIVGVNIRLTTVTGAVGHTINTVVRPYISEALSLYDLTDLRGSTMKQLPLPLGSADFDNYTETGYTYLSTGQSYVHSPLPDTEPGLLRIYNTGSVVTQIVIGTTTPKHYVRRSFNGTWSDWTQDNNEYLEKGEAGLFGVDDLLWDVSSPSGSSLNGIDWTVNRVTRCINADGTALSDSVLNIFRKTSSLPSWVELGKPYVAHLNSDTGIRFQVIEFYADSSYSIIASTDTHETFKFSTDAVGASFRLYAPAGTSVVSTDLYPFVSECLNLKELNGRRTIKILSLGNSGHQDMLTYVPFILQNVAPELDITLGISYKGGATIQTQIDLFENSDGTQTVEYDLYKAGRTAWHIRSGWTLKSVLTDEDWDIILVGQASSYQMNFANYSKIPELIDKVTEYVATDNGDYKGHSVKWGYLGPQVRIAQTDNTHPPEYHVIETPSDYPNYMSAVQQAMNAYPLEFCIMGGTAIENARGTTLDQYGDAVFDDGTSGHMNADYTHMQEGIGCMVGSYCSVLSILELAGIDNRSILGEGTRPDAAWISAHSIPGQNYGSGVVGISDANCLIAQKCAVMAHKKPFEVSTIY